MRDLPGLNKFSRVSFSIKMCIEISAGAGGYSYLALSELLKDFKSGQ
jgi:hypothetical protein